MRLLRIEFKSGIAIKSKVISILLKRFFPIMSEVA